MAHITFEQGSYGFLAEMDYEDLHAVLNIKPVRGRMICFLAEQCIEKYLKQVIKVTDSCESYLRMDGENLLRLARYVKYPRVEEFRLELASLGELYSLQSHPEDTKELLFVNPTSQDVKKVLMLVESVRDWTFQIIEGMK